MSKRKREVRDEGSRPASSSKPQPKKQGSHASHQQAHQITSLPDTLQIITGSYDRVLHGFTATFDLSKNTPESGEAQPEVSFADTFMFNAHSSAIRCLALSPLTSEPDGTPSKLILASGGTDERVNLYAISGNAPSPSYDKVAAALSLSSIVREENPKNREIGSLIHHSSTITQLCFASKSKLLSASEDNTIAVSRTRDWTVLTTFKAPTPKIMGRPSGDTAPPGGAPAGVNDFDIHPSMKIMISVGKGERSMRLWDLVRGKKAGALDFDRELLQAVGETKHATGEARSILFAPSGNGFVISFDRGAVVLDMQSQIQGLVLPVPRTKLHKMRFLPGELANVLAICTDDGRILFFDTENFVTVRNGKKSPYQNCQLLAQLGGPTEGVATRIKSFQIIELTSKANALAVVSCCSDGSTRLWHLDSALLARDSAEDNAADKDAKSAKIKQVGHLLARYDTANRIVCMEAFKMLPPVKLGTETKNKNDDVEERQDDGDEFSGFD